MSAQFDTGEGASTEFFVRRLIDDEKLEEMAG